MANFKISIENVEEEIIERVLADERILKGLAQYLIANLPEVKDGEKGETGPEGKPGKDGKDGKDGEKGEVGPKGKPGKDGRPGKDGKDGVSGLDGSQIEPEEIIKKINSLPLTPDKQIDAKHIKGLPKFDKKFGSKQISGTGIGWKLVTSGTVGTGNKTFGVKKEPKEILIDGLIYIVNNGFTFSGGNITTDIAPQGWIRVRY